ncbi:MAG: hypothetical protein NTZ42_02060 [Candidatus Gribaldobacteria bacterium]|nr:hypothetical protein [Candidatus Gribaldobacteria bacterium]
MAKTCLSSSLIVFASKATAAKNEKELLTVLEDLKLFIRDTKISIEQGSKQVLEKTPAEKFAEMTSG